MLYKLDWIQYEYEPTMTVQKFVNENLDYYTQKHLEEYPTHAQAINNGEIECVGEMVDEDEVVEVMVELYKRFLDDN